MKDSRQGAGVGEGVVAGIVERVRCVSCRVRCVRRWVEVVLRSASVVFSMVLPGGDMFFYSCTLYGNCRLCQV